MAWEEPGPGRKYALQARKHIAVLRKARPDIIIEIRWCPTHKRASGNEKADEGVKFAAEDPDTHGVEWLSHTDQPGARAMPLHRSLAHLKRENTEKKWAEARQWAGPPERNIRCRRAGGPTGRLRVFPRDSPQGSTN